MRPRSPSEVALLVARLLAVLAFADATAQERLKLRAAAAPLTHLEPIAAEDFEWGEKRNARRVLGLDLIRCDSTLLIVPSFDRELGICVGEALKNESPSGSVIIASRPSRSLMAHGTETPAPTIAHHRRAITNRLRDAIQRAVGTAALRARYSSEGYRVLDGEDGYFSAFVWPLGYVHGRYMGGPGGVALELRKLAFELEQFATRSANLSERDEAPLLRRVADIERLAARS